MEAACPPAETTPIVEQKGVLTLFRVSHMGRKGCHPSPEIPVFKPTGCHYHIFSADEAAACLDKRHLVFMGDSVMRGLVGALEMLLREATVDAGDPLIALFEFGNREQRQGGGLRSTNLLKFLKEDILTTWPTVSAVILNSGLHDLAGEPGFSLDDTSPYARHSKDEHRTAEYTQDPIALHETRLRAVIAQLKRRIPTSARLILKTTALTAPMYAKCETSQQHQATDLVAMLLQLKLTNRTFVQSCSKYYQRHERIMALNRVARKVARQMGVAVLDMEHITSHGQLHWFDDLVHFDGGPTQCCLDADGYHANAKLSAAGAECGVPTKMSLHILLNMLCPMPSPESDQIFTLHLKPPLLPWGGVA